MEDINNSTLTTDNGVLQINPETSRDEQMAFIDTLRSIQNTQNQEIQDATHALGTDTTPRYGGLNGTNSYWLNQYQTPQTEARIASLQSAAQSAALQTAMNNYLANLQEDYNQAYRRASKRSSSYGGSGGTTTTPTTTDSGAGDVEYVSTGSKTSTEDAFSKRAFQDYLGETVIPTVQDLREKIKQVFSSSKSSNSAASTIGDSLTQFKLGS